MEESGRKRSYVWFCKCNSMWIAFDFKREREREENPSDNFHTHSNKSSVASIQASFSTNIQNKTSGIVLSKKTYFSIFHSKF
jgi:hypothetical protein